MSCKKATASDVDRQHIARRTATRAMSAPTSQSLRPTTASANPTQQDAYELRSEPAADYAGNRIVSYCFSARPATLLHLPRRPLRVATRPRGKAQGCKAGAMRVQEILKELADVADERPRGTAPHAATYWSRYRRTVPPNACAKA